MTKIQITETSCLEHLNFEFVSDFGFRYSNLTLLCKVGAGHSPSTVCRYMVSGTFNSPKRGTFHRSLALLFTIGRRVVLSLGGWTPRLHTEFHELRVTLEHQRRYQAFAYRTITLFGRPFQTVLLTIHLLMPVPTTPESKLSSLGYSAFARRY
jgi:hypothetical protein